MTPAEVAEMGVKVSMIGFAVGLLWLFIAEVFLGFITWMKSFIG